MEGAVVRVEGVEGSRPSWDGPRTIFFEFFLKSAQPRVSRRIRTFTNSQARLESVFAT